MKHVLLICIFASMLALSCSVAAQEEDTNARKETAKLTLEKCLLMARTRNNDILRAREELEKTRGIIKEGYSAAMPMVKATGTYTRIDESSIQEFEGIKFGSDEIYTAGVTLDQKLYSGGKVGAGIRAAKLADLLARAGLLTTMRNVEYDVKTAFYNVLLTRDLIDVQVEAVELFAENLKNVEAKKREGQVNELEVLRAKVALSNLQPDLIRARNNYRLSLDALKQVLNLPLGMEINVDGTLASVPLEVDLDLLVETAMANRSEISAQELTMKLRKENLTVARSGRKPELSLTGGYSGETDTFGDSDATDLNWGWSAGLVLSVTLFDGFGTEARVIQTTAELNQARIDLEKVKDGIELEVRQAYFKFGEAAEVLDSQRKNVEQAEETVRQSQVLADLGQIAQFDLRDVQLELRTARTNFERALYEYNVAMAKLEQAAGYDVMQLGSTNEEE